MRSFAASPFKFALSLAALLAVLAAQVARADDFKLDPEQIKAALHTDDRGGARLHRADGEHGQRRQAAPRHVHKLLHLGPQEAPPQVPVFQARPDAPAAIGTEIGNQPPLKWLCAEFRLLLHHWWHRPCGGREVLALAGPLVISTVSFTVMTFIDRMFLTHYSLDAVAAAMPAAMLQFTLISFPLGVASTSTRSSPSTTARGGRGRSAPSSGRASGSDWPRSRFSCFQPRWPTTIFSMPGHDPDVVVEEIIYYDVLVYGSARWSSPARFPRSSPAAARRGW